MTQRQNNCANHRNKQNQSSRLEDVCVIGIDQTTKCLDIADPCRRWLGKNRNRLVGQRPSGTDKRQFDEQNNRDQNPDRQVVQETWRISTKLMSSIITTNRNRTATAPT